MTQKDKIVWKGAELELVAREYVRLEALDPREVGFRRLKRAELVLPKDRQRGGAIVNNTSLISPKVQAAIAAARKALEKEGPQPAHAVASMRDEPAREPAAALPPPEPPPAFKMLGEQMREWVVGVLTDVVCNVIEHPIVKAYISSPNPRNIDILDWIKRANPEALAQRHSPYPVSFVERKDKPIVVIIGIKPSQKQGYWDRFGRVFELRFWYDEGAERLKERTKNAWRVLATLDATGHHAIRSVESIGVKVQLVGGAQSSMFDALDELRLEAYPELRPPPEAQSHGEAK